MAKTYLNTGEAFIHPLNGKYVAHLAYYEGAAHRPHENVERVEIDEPTGDEEPIVDDSVPLESLSHTKLKQLAKDKGIAGYSTKSPEELIELLKAGE